MAVFKELSNAQRLTKWGKFLESLVKGDLVKLLSKRNIKVDMVRSRLVASDSTGKEVGEFDVVAMNGKEIFAIEVKTTLTKEKVEKFINKLKIVRAFLKKRVGDISLPLLEQLSDWITSGEMRSRDGKVDYGDMGKNVQIPTLLMSGGYDSFSPPHALLKTYSEIPLPSRKKKMVILSKISRFSFDYCHAGIIAGKKARKEVFPILLAWLDRFSRV